MKAITIHQPGASLLAHGIKKFETRAWPVPSKLLGQCVAIHAAKTKQGMKGVSPETLMEYGMPDYRKAPIPFGAIIGYGRIIRSQKIFSRFPSEGGHRMIFEGKESPESMFISGKEESLGDWSIGRYVWLFEDVYLFPKPLLCRGYHKFWTVDGEIHDEMPY